MPFHKHARITIENQHKNPIPAFFYQIDYCLYDSLPEDTSYFHAQWRRQAITEIGKDYVILDNVKGSGHYVGTYLGLLLRCTFMCINKHGERYSFSLLHSSVMSAA